MYQLYARCRRAPRTIAWLLVMFAFDFFVVPLANSIGPIEGEVLGGLLAGPVIGQCALLAILGGLYGTTWIDGFRVAGLASVLGFSLFMLGGTMSQGTPPPWEEIWAVLGTIPGIMFAVLAPILLMRHFGNWRLVDPRRRYPKQPADIGSIFLSTAVVAMILVSLQMSKLVFRMPTATFWLGCSATGIVLLLISSVLTLPLATFVVNCDSGRQRIGRLGLSAALAFGVFFLCMTAIGMAFSGGPPVEFFVAAGFATASAAFVVLLGVQAIRGDGFRLRTKTNDLATRTLPQSVEEKNYEQTYLARHRKRMLFQVLSCFAVLVAFNAYVTSIHSAQARYKRGVAEIRSIAKAHGGYYVEELRGNRFKLRWTDTLKVRAGEQQVASVLSKYRIYDSLVSLDYSEVDRFDFTFHTPKLESLDISYTKSVDDVSYYLRGQSSLQHFAAKGVNLMGVDLGSTERRRLKSLVLDGATLDPTALATLVKNCRLERLELNDVRIDGTVLDSIRAQPPNELRFLGLAGAKQVTDAGLAEFEAFSFKELNLSRTKITDACATSLRACLDLDARELQLAGTALTDEGVSQLATCSISDLLDLSETRVTGEAFRGWKLFPLRLKLSKTEVGDELVETLLSARAVQLTKVATMIELDLSHTRITDAVVMPLSTLLHCTTIDVSHTNVTAKGLAEVAQQSDASQVLHWRVEEGKFTDAELVSLRSAGVGIRVGTAQLAN